MRFVTVRRGGRPRLGIVDGEYVYLFGDDLLSFIERGSLIPARKALTQGRRRIRAGRKHPDVVALAGARILAPIPLPRKNIFCVGRNYAEHARESGSQPPEVPVFFTKPPTCIVGPEAPVVHHAVTRQLDYEIELAVIIGKRGRNIPAERALGHVFGYTIINDVTARDLQLRHQQWFKGKSLDTFAPMGPAVVHRSRIPDPQNLRLRMRVNGEMRQDASTVDMLFPVARLIADLSAGMTLDPGDIIATGTPAGVAMGRTPPAWLQPGDVAEAEIEGIGTLRNRIVAP